MKKILAKKGCDLGDAVMPVADAVIPAKAGIHFTIVNMDSRFRGNDGMFGGRDAFSLLETLIVLALAAVLALGGFYGWQHWQERTQRSLVIHEVQQALMFAKQSALARHEPVSVCAAASDTQCGLDWSQGLLVFVDPDGQGQPGSEALLLRVPAFPRGQVLQWRGWLKHTSVRFDADGLPHSYHGSFYLAHDEAPFLVINAVGRIRIASNQ